MILLKSFKKICAHLKIRYIFTQDVIYLKNDLVWTYIVRSTSTYNLSQRWRAV